MDIPMEEVYLLCPVQWKKNRNPEKSETLQGTLDQMVMKVLDALGPQHGYGIARRIEQVSEQVLQLNGGTEWR
jgi:hypothetical protein